MSVRQEKAGKSGSTRIWAVVLIAFLTVAAIVGYLGYSNLAKLQLDQSALQAEFSESKFSHGWSSSRIKRVPNQQ